MPVLRRRLWLFSLGLFAAIDMGCGKKPSLIPASGGTPTVTVSMPIERPVTDYVDYTGRTDAVFMTEIRPRVNGYLVGMPFKEGALVKKGQVLFEVDPAPYQATLDQAKGFVEFCQAALVKTQAEYDIALAVQKESKKAISEQEITKRLGARDEMKGDLARALGALKTAEINLGWCKVLSPIDGQVNKFNLTIGNVVNADQTVLTTVMSTNPMFVYFDADENNYLAVMRRLVLPAKTDLAAKTDIPVLMGLADEEGFPHRGYLDFSANAINPSTGTLTLRGVFENPANEFNKRLLRPGMFVRVRLPLGKPKPAILVSERAIVSDQTNKCLLIVDKKNTVEYRRVTLGPLQEDGLRVIESGLKPNELVIVNGLQLVRPRMEVKTEKKDMPTLPRKAPPEASSAPAEPEKTSPPPKSKAPEQKPSSK